MIACGKERLVLKDIRTTSGEEHWEELRRRWTSLLSYRYLGRSHANLNSGPADPTMKLRHDMRNSSGGIMAAPLCIASPEGGGISDEVAVPNPVIHSLQILDDARDVSRIEVVPEVLKQGQRMGFSRSLIVDADNRDRVIALTAGQGVSIGEVPPGFEKMEEEKIVVEDSPDLPPLLQGLRGVASRRRALGPAGAGHRIGLARRGAPPRPPAHPARDGGQRARGGMGR